MNNDSEGTYTGVFYSVTPKKTPVFFKDTKIPSRSILKNAVILDKIRNTSFVQRFPLYLYDRRLFQACQDEAHHINWLCGKFHRLILR